MSARSVFFVLENYRHRRGSNTRSSLYESDALPLGHCARRVRQNHLTWRRDYYAPSAVSSLTEYVTFIRSKWCNCVFRLLYLCQPGVVACTCNVATYRLNLRTAWVRDHYWSVVYVDQVSMLSLVSTWSSWRNSRCTGFDSEVRTGPGRKRSRQKYPH